MPAGEATSTLEEFKRRESVWEDILKQKFTIESLCHYFQGAKGKKLTNQCGPGLIPAVRPHPRPASAHNDNRHFMFV